MTVDDSESGSQEWCADDYDDAHGFVTEYGSSVVDLLEPREGERVLDLGCGTGHLAREIADAGAAVVGIDASAEMIARAREQYSDSNSNSNSDLASDSDSTLEIEFVRGDARDLADALEGTARRARFDAVFSNAALHWIPDDDQDAVLASVRDVLERGGRFVGELGGRGNVAAIVEAVRAECAARGYDARSPWYFPSVGEYASRLEARGFEVRYARLFDRPTELEEGEAGLRNWLEMFGDALLESVPESERDEVVGAVEDRLREEWFREGTWIAPYRRLRFVAIAPAQSDSEVDS